MLRAPIQYQCATAMGAFCGGLLWRLTAIGRRVRRPPWRLLRTDPRKRRSSTPL